MSLLLILTKIWKYKLLTLPIIVLILVGAFYVVAVTAPTYESTSTYILVNPPPPPTDEEIARDPALGKIKDDNPYTRFSDQSVLVQVLASRLASEDTRRALAKQGADPNYTATPSAEFGFSAPILQITGMGTSAAQAITTANLVGEALTRELDKMQADRGVDKSYRIKTEAVVPARTATLKPSGKLRALVAVFVLGTVMLFIVISLLDALGALRAEWAKRGATEEHLDSDMTFAPPVPLRRDSISFSDPDPNAPPWPREAQK
jgi:capsular polysaccharide biosynthesis protein